VSTAEDVIEYLLAGASAVGIGTAHFADPKVARKIMRRLPGLVERMGAASIAELIGGMKPW
jgi:dihydroorotate dehydrogenase